MKKIILACFLLWTTTVNITDLSRIVVNSFSLILKTHEQIMDSINFRDREETHHLSNSYTKLENFNPIECHPPFCIILVQKVFPGVTITQLVEQGALEHRTTLSLNAYTSRLKKGDETGWAQRHAYLRGWIKADRDGKYIFIHPKIRLICSQYSAYSCNSP